MAEYFSFPSINYCGVVALFHERLCDYFSTKLQSYNLKRELNTIILYNVIVPTS